jgi:membrane associated rhomboid family serine protease
MPDSATDRNAGWRALAWPLLFACCAWLVFGVQWAAGTDLHELGILPRSWQGLVGILTAPFVHQDINHITSNTVPLLVVGTGLFYFYREIAWRVVVMIWLLTGFWVWLAARESYHIGASGLIYGFVCFLFFSGLLRRDRQMLALSMLVTFLYGSMVWGILPVDQRISWEAHLFGSFAGIFAAVVYRKDGPVREKYSWELEEEQEAEDAAAGIDHGTDWMIHYDYKEKPSSGSETDEPK